MRGDGIKALDFLEDMRVIAEGMIADEDCDDQRTLDKEGATAIGGTTADRFLASVRPFKSIKGGGATLPNGAPADEYTVSKSTSIADPCTNCESDPALALGFGRGGTLMAAADA